MPETFADHSFSGHASSCMQLLMASNGHLKTGPCSIKTELGCSHEFTCNSVTRAWCVTSQRYRHARARHGLHQKDFPRFSQLRPLRPEPLRFSRARAPRGSTGESGPAPPTAEMRRWTFRAPHGGGVLYENRPYLVFSVRRPGFGKEGKEGGGGGSESRKMRVLGEVTKPGEALSSIMAAPCLVKIAW